MYSFIFMQISGFRSIRLCMYSTFCPFQPSKVNPRPLENVPQHDSLATEQSNSVWDFKQYWWELKPHEPSEGCYIEVYSSLALWIWSNLVVIRIGHHFVLCCEHVTLGLFGLLIRQEAMTLGMWGGALSLFAGSVKWGNDRQSAEVPYKLNFSFWAFFPTETHSDLYHSRSCSL